MIISNTVLLRSPPQESYTLLLDLDAIAPSIPGASLLPATDSDTRAGTVVVRFGPMSFSYSGTVQITSADPVARTAVLEAKGEETSGEGTIRAVITMAVEAYETGSRVSMQSDLQLSGAAAQLGRAMIEDFAEVMLQDFADEIARQLERPGGQDSSVSPAPAVAVRPLHARKLIWRVFVARLRRLRRLFARRHGPRLAVSDPGSLAETLPPKE